MFCSECGTELAANSTFCSNCGKVVAMQPTVESTISQPRSFESVPRSQMSAGLTKKQTFTIVPWALILIFLYAGKLINASNGEIDVDGKSAFQLMFFTGGVFWYFWKILNLKGWIGGVVGVAVSILIIMLSAVVTGYVRGQPEYILEHTSPYPAIKKHFPKEYESMRKELIAAAKKNKLTDEDITGLLGKKITPLLNQSLKTTSDSAIYLLAKAKLSSFRDVAKVNTTDCYVLMSGTIYDVDPATQIRILNYMSPETRTLNREAMQKMIEDKNTSWESLDTPASEEHYNALLDRLDVVLSSKYSLSAYYFTDDSLKVPVDVRCKAGLALWEEVMNLSLNDRAFMLRRFFDSESKF